MSEQRKDRAGDCCSMRRPAVVEQRYVQPDQTHGALGVIISGLKPDDRVVVDLWRATPGTKVTPQLTSIEATSAGAKP